MHVVSVLLRGASQDQSTFRLGLPRLNEALGYRRVDDTRGAFSLAPLTDFAGRLSRRCFCTCGGVCSCAPHGHNGAEYTRHRTELTLTYVSFDCDRVDNSLVSHELYVAIQGATFYNCAVRDFSPHVRRLHRERQHVCFLSKICSFPYSTASQYVSERQ